MTKAAKHSLDQLLADFALHHCARDPGRPVTVWLPSEYKTRYARLQKASGRQFGKKVRELILAAIELAESKAP